MKSRTRAIVVGAISGLAILGAGCGSNPSGTYTVNETLSGNSNLPATCAASQIQLSVNDSGNSFSASGSGGCITTENVFGSDNNGSITGVSLSLVINPQYGSSNCGLGQQYCGSGSVGMGGSYSCSYTGNMSLSGNTLTGSLSLQGNTTGTIGSVGINGCPQTITLNGSKTG